MKETNHETKPESNVSKLYEEMEARSAAHKRESNELLRFFGGLLLFGAGMYMIFQNLVISSSWGMLDLPHRRIQCAQRHHYDPDPDRHCTAVPV